MKLLDKLKKQRYDISMQIIHLENKDRNKKEEQQLSILKKKEAELDKKINTIKE